MKKEQIVSAITSLVLMLSFSSVLAENGNGNGSSDSANGKSRNEIIQEKKAVIAERRCEMAQKRVATRTKFYSQQEEKHQQIYGKVIEKLNGLVIKFKEVGLDTSKLESYLPILKTKIEKLHTDHEAFIQKLTQTENYACGESQENFKNALKAAREYGKTTIKTDLADIRNYVKNTIRPELINLRNQFEAQEAAKETPTPTPTVLPTEVQ